jgi:hypothetical protein
VVKVFIHYLTEQQNKAAWLHYEACRDRLDCSSVEINHICQTAISMKANRTHSAIFSCIYTDCSFFKNTLEYHKHKHIEVINIPLIVGTIVMSIISWQKCSVLKTVKMVKVRKDINNS